MKLLQSRLFWFITVVAIIAVDWASKFYFANLLQLGQSLQVIGERFLQWQMVHNYGVSFGIGREHPELIRWGIGLFSLLAAAVAIRLGLGSLRNQQLHLAQDAQAKAAQAADKAHKTTKTPSAYHYWETLQGCGYFLLAAGGIGNGVDRLVNGYVIDFIKFTIGNHEFHVFNVADIAINLAVVCLLVSVVMFTLGEKNQPQQGSNDSSAHQTDKEN